MTASKILTKCEDSWAGYMDENYPRAFKSDLLEMANKIKNGGFSSIPDELNTKMKMEIYLLSVDYLKYRDLNDKKGDING